MKRLKSLFLILTLVIAAFFSACADKQSLESPSNLSVNVDNVLSWREIAEARTYTVEAENTETLEKQEKNVRKPKIDLEFLQTGDYVLRVRANAGKQDSVQSAWSEGLSFRKNYTTGCVYELINNDSEYSIKQVGTSTTGVVTFEDTYRGKPVTRIGDGAFRGSSRVTGLVLGKNIYSIGLQAFYNCANLETALLNDSLKSIGAGAFQSCSSLKSVNIPSGVTKIEDDTFGYCNSLESIDFPAKLQDIGESAFSNCTSLKEVVIPDLVSSLGDYVFYAASGLKTVKFGKNLRSLGVSSFMNCLSLEKIEFYGDNEEEGANSLEDIGSSSFYGCEKLTTVHLPEGVKKVGDYTFSDCKMLQELKIPDSVDLIGKRIVMNTKLYEEQKENGYIYADGWLTQLTAQKKGEFSEKKKDANGNESYILLNLNCPISDGAEKRMDIDSETRGIAAYVFSDCGGLRVVQIPKKVKVVGEGAFSQCGKLMTVKSISGSALRVIGDLAFAECAVLSTAQFPVASVGTEKGKGVEEIGDYAFYGTGMGSVKLPPSLVRIGKDAYLKSSLWEKSSGVVVADNWVVGYKTDKPIGSVSLKDKVGIADYAFAKCVSLTDIKETESLKYIGRSAFYESSLRYISLGNNITEIKDYTFYKTPLDAIGLPIELKKIGRSAFYETLLTGIDFSESDNLESLGDYAFYSANSLMSVNFGTTLKSIGKKAFYNCSALNRNSGELKLPDSLETIGDSAFENCSNLGSVSFGSNLKTIGNRAFMYSYLTEVTIPDSVEKIGDFAFYGLRKLESIKLGNGLKEVGTYAFCAAKSVTNVLLPESLETLGDYAFRECDSLRYVAVRKNSGELGMHSFYWCEELTIYTDAGTEDNSWIKFWNSSYRPVVYSCEFSEDGTYVVSAKTGCVKNGSALGGAGDPYRDGYDFVGWATEKDATAAEFTTAQIAEMAEGTTVYAVWAVKAAEDGEETETTDA